MSVVPVLVSLFNRRSVLGQNTRIAFIGLPPDHSLRAGWADCQGCLSAGLSVTAGRNFSVAAISNHLRLMLPRSAVDIEVPLGLTGIWRGMAEEDDHGGFALPPLRATDFRWRPKGDRNHKPLTGPLQKLRAAEDSQPLQRRPSEEISDFDDAWSAKAYINRAIAGGALVARIQPDGLIWLGLPLREKR